MNNKKKTFLLIGILVLTMLLVSGGTFAYFRWISSEDQQTNLAIQIEENISMHIENPLLTKAGMYPTNTCTNEAATMSGVSIIALENQTGVIARPKFKLRVKITDKDGNVITNNSAGTDNGNNPYRYFINYAVAEENGTCTEPLYSGNFDQNAPTYQGQTQWYDSEWITLTSENTGFPLISNGQDSGVSFNGTPYQTTYHNYKVWVWIDESYVSVNTGDVVSDKLQDAKIELSWSENSTVQQIKAQAYAVFSSSAEGGDDSLRFYQSDEPITEDSTYAGRPVTNVYTGFETEDYYDFSVLPWYDITNIRGKIKTVIVEDTISPISTAYWFDSFVNATYFDLTKLDTSNVTNMRYMFAGTSASNTKEFSIIGMENWDTSNVTNMSYMFYYAGRAATTFNISDISGWNTSNVTNMYSMFYDTGVADNDWSLDLSDWNAVKVIQHDYFNAIAPSGTGGYNESIIPPDWYTSYAVYSGEDNSLRFYRTTTDLMQEDEWDGIGITNVYTGFENIAYSSASQTPWYSDRQSIYTVEIKNEIYPISTAYWFADCEYVTYIDVTKLDVSNVTGMQSVFSRLGYNVSSNNKTQIIGIENWNVSNVTDMSGMFRETYNVSDVDLSRWNVSKVTNMANMFNDSLSVVGDLSKWDVSSVTNMSNMFWWSGIKNLNISNWDTSSVTNMNQMFYHALIENNLDLSKWNVSNVTDYDNFNTDAEDKVKAPSKFSS